MGFSIFIGEKKIRSEEGQKIASAEEMENNSSPLNPSGEGYSNHWQPSYVSLHDFSTRTGLKKLFDEILENHPGCVSLKKSHLSLLRIPIKSRLKMFKEYDKERLLWLEFWFNWALENCVDPCISNS